LVEPGISDDQHELLVTAEGDPVWIDEQGSRPGVDVVDAVRSLLVDGNRLAVGGNGLWAQDGLVGAKMPVAGTPFSLVILVPEDAVFRQAAPLVFLLAAGSIPLIVLAAAFFLGRLRRLNATLKLRYLESDRRRGELQGKYTALESEVQRREAVERELRLQREQLEVRTRELQAAMDEAHHLAMYDGLTGLSNRVLFRESLRQAIGTAKKKGHKLAVLFLDVDRFKRINDTLGHTAGDQLLREVAKRVEHCVRQSDLVSRAGQGGERNTYVARQGGDEFTVLLTELGEPVQAALVAQRIIEVLARSINLDGHEVVVTGSVGISIYPGDGEDVDTLLKNADAAMYHAKEKGRNQYQFYEQSMHATAMRRLAIENEMRQGIEQEQFEVFYQPMMDARAGRIVGAEALLRWHHPSRGLVSPAEFIPVAEESGLIVPLTEYVLNRACRQIAAWERQTGMQISVAVNLSGRTLALADVYDMIDRSLRLAEAPATLLELELTESVLMESRETAQRLMRRLKQRGVRVSIDDFGTGYSSLSYLKTLVIDTLKIDRSFVQDLPGDRDSEAIVRTIVGMARTLNLRVVAEGVETGDQYAFLSGLGVDLVQGFLFGKPAPEPEITRHLLASSARESAPAPAGAADAHPATAPAESASGPAVSEFPSPSLEEAA
jgi:diguanylate cyclase (GGDEF)-like protein